MEAAALAAVSHPAAEVAEAGSDGGGGSWQEGVPLDAVASYWGNIEKIA